MPIATILLIVLVILLIAGLPHWPYSNTLGMGYGPSSVAAVLIVVLLVLLLLGRI